MKIARALFDEMVSIEHLFHCWLEFKRGKKKRKDLQSFEGRIEDRLFHLKDELSTLSYRHGPYDHFYVTDPKQRRISKASVKDRLVHQIVYATLSPVFDKTFIFDSFSSRLGKGTHAGIARLRNLLQKASRNGKKPCYALKMDIKRFFDTVDHALLKTLLCRTICDTRMIHLVDTIIDSFHTDAPHIGLPLGNVTSQLFANVYLNELDLYIKHQLREPYYLRYCDDFILLSNGEAHLKGLIDPIRGFLQDTLHLRLHPKKISLKKFTQGIDFLGYVLFPHYTRVRTKTKKRLKKRLQKTHEHYVSGHIAPTALNQCLQSYLGVLSHADEFTLSSHLKNSYSLSCRK